MVMMMIMIKYKIKININCTCKIINYIKHKNNNKKYNNHIQNLKITIIKQTNYQKKIASNFIKINNLNKEIKNL